MSAAPATPRAQAPLPPLTKALESAKPTHQTALVLIPPESCWAPIQAIRKQHDRSFERWMPHINLLYGFVPAAGVPKGFVPAS